MFINTSTKNVCVIQYYYRFLQKAKKILHRLCFYSVLKFQNIPLDKPFEWKTT